MEDGASSTLESCHSKCPITRKNNYVPHSILEKNPVEELKYTKRVALQNYVLSKNVTELCWDASYVKWWSFRIFWFTYKNTNCAKWGYERKSFDGGWEHIQTSLLGGMCGRMVIYLFVTRNGA